MRSIPFLLPLLQSSWTLCGDPTRWPSVAILPGDPMWRSYQVTLCGDPTRWPSVVILPSDPLWACCVNHSVVWTLCCVNQPAVWTTLLVNHSAVRTTLLCEPLCWWTRPCCVNHSVGNENTMFCEPHCWWTALLCEPATSCVSLRSWPLVVGYNNKLSRILVVLSKNCSNQLVAILNSNHQSVGVLTTLDM
jgi:hypothetical protein